MEFLRCRFNSYTALVKITQLITERLSANWGFLEEILINSFS